MTENLKRPRWNSINLHKVAIGAIGKVDKLEKELEAADPSEMPSVDYRLPCEREENTAYVDEFLLAGALRHGDATMFFQFRGDQNARLRYITPEYDRLAHVKYSETGPQMPGRYSRGGVFKTMRYGPYFIVMNGSEEERFEYEAPDDMQGETVINLRTGERRRLKKHGVLPPASSASFVLAGEGNK